MTFDATVGGRTVRVEVRGGQGRYTVALDGVAMEVDFLETGRSFASLLVGGESHEVAIESRPEAYMVLFPADAVTVGIGESSRGALPAAARHQGAARLTAPMPGRVVRVLRTSGTDVAAGEGLVVIEAMKMENELKSPRGGRVREVAVREGQTVEAGALLMVVE